MADEDSESVEYDPESPTPPAREPPYRSTAPQSDFTSGQVLFGLVVAFVGLAFVFGLAFVV